jgi:hypothetical protein
MFWRSLEDGKYKLRPLFLPNLTAIVGQFGTGKSLYLLELGLRLANLLKKKLVVNFPINVVEVKKFCYAARLDWFYACGRIIQLDWNIDSFEKLPQLLSFGSSVICFDEAGILINARNWRHHSQQFFESLNQLRSKNVHLILAFHFLDQVDKHLRMVIQHWIYCRAKSDPEPGWTIPKLKWRGTYHYDAESFAIYQNLIQVRVKRGRRRKLTKFVETENLAFGKFTSELTNLILAIKLLLASSGRGFTSKELFFKGMFESYYEMLFKCFKSDYVFKRQQYGSQIPSGAIPVSKGGNYCSVPRSSFVVQDLERLIL